MSEERWAGKGWMEKEYFVMVLGWGDGQSILSLYWMCQMSVMKRVRARTECAIGEEQSGFRQGWGCMDRMFAARQVCEKYLANGKDVFWAFIDFGNACEWCDTINRQGMWQMKRMYGVGGKLLKAAQSFYIDSRPCVWLVNDVGEWFPGYVGLRQGCVMSPWLFNIYIYTHTHMDSVVR